MKINRFFFIISLCLGLHTGATFACRYNVRDIGFIDLDKDSYVLYGFVADGSPTDFAAEFLRASGIVFEECNARAEIVDTSAQSRHPALKYLNDGEASSSPKIVFVSPDGQSMPISLPESGGSLPRILSPALEPTVTSPIRKQLLDTICEAFGAILLIEGTDSEANDRARQAVLASIKRIGEQMKWMPKAIARPPKMIAMKPETFPAEQVLLWSLGLNTEPTPEPRAAVIYGKARWIGPMMTGEEIAEQNLVGIFSIIGADCECSYDISWTQGTRLPLRWDRDRHAALVKSLGFDPENPLIKMEASRILGRGTLAASIQADSLQEEAKLGKPDAPPSKALPNMDEPEKTPPPMRTPPEKLGKPMAEPKKEPILRTLWLVIAGMVVFIALASVWITSRADARE